MKLLNKIVLILAISAFMSVIIAYYADLISMRTLILDGSLSVSLLSTATALILLKNGPKVLKIIGSIAAWLGFLICALSIFHFVELKTFWAISLSLSALSLLIGLLSNFVETKNTPFKWAGFVSAFLLLLAFLAIGLKINHVIFYSLGAIVLVIFSILVLLRTIIRRKSVI